MFAVLAPSVAVWAGVACAQRRGGETEQQVSLSACDTVSQVQSPIPARLPAVSRPDGSMSSVVGMVQDRQTGAALAGVVLRFESLRQENARTDSAGGFVLRNLPPGTYHVFVTRIGYDAVRDTLSLSAAVVDTVSYRLQYRSCP